MRQRQPPMKRLEPYRRVKASRESQMAAVLAEGLKRTFDRLEDGQRALAIGHSPTNEAAVFGLTGVVVVPMGKGQGVVVVDTGDGYEVEAAE